MQVKRIFTVEAPQTVVVDYLADFGNAEEWDPGTVSCTRLDSGPVSVGARWRNVSKVLGKETELTYELVEKRPDGVVLRGHNKTATSVDDIRALAVEGVTRVEYRATVTFHGLAKLADPFMRLVFERLAGETVRLMTQALTREVGRR